MSIIRCKQCGLVDQNHPASVAELTGHEICEACADHNWRVATEELDQALDEAKRRAEEEAQHKADERPIIVGPSSIEGQPSSAQ